MEHFAEAFTDGGADAVLAASLFHTRAMTIRDLKDFLEQRGVSVR
jgi:cyclase